MEVRALGAIAAGLSLTLFDHRKTLRMLGLLMDVVARAKPSLAEFKIVDSQGEVNVFVNRPKYTLGLVPQRIGEEEVHVATIAVTQSDDGFDLVVKKEWATHRFPLTIPNSGRLEDSGSEQGWVFEWRLDQAAEELSRCLKEQC